MNEWCRTKSLSEGKMIYNDGHKNRRSTNSLHYSSWQFRAVFNVNRAAKGPIG